MSRTTRRDRKDRTVRDGADIRPSRSCRHHGSCSYCKSNRTHATVRSEPIEESLILETRRLK